MQKRGFNLWHCETFFAPTPYVRQPFFETSELIRWVLNNAYAESQRGSRWSNGIGVPCQGGTYTLIGRNYKALLLVLGPLLSLQATKHTRNGKNVGRPLIVSYMSIQMRPECTAVAATRLRLRLRLPSQWQKSLATLQSGSKTCHSTKKVPRINFPKYVIPIST